MNTLEVQSLSEWHDWLIENQDRVEEVWVIFDKQKPGMRYQESVEEALCFGWIDSLIKNISENRHARKFTPRKPGSKWSELNIERAQRMIKEGRMTEKGRRLFEEGRGNVAPSGSTRKEIMEAWRLELMGRLDAQTLTLFTDLPPSLQRQYAGWVMSGKLEETRQKRIAELNSTLAKGQRLGLK
jgi:uncharacterized protein YdeI (YjbR/CyaY-like superfamily)